MIMPRMMFAWQKLTSVLAFALLEGRAGINLKKPMVMIDQEFLTQ